jgi:ABC-type transport system involved in multi-copper enzyme maturation permease subunit
VALALPRLEDLRDPLLERDYVRLCSRPAFFRNRALAALGVGALLLLMYALADDDEPLDELGRSFHLVFTWLAAAIAGVVAATEAAVAIPTERATGSLTVLLTVPRKPLRLAAGFFLSRVLVALTALLAMLPLEGMALLMGGIDARIVGTGLYVVFVSAIYGAAAGLFAGYDARDHRLAVGRTGLLIMVLALILPLAVGLFGLVFHSWDPDHPSPKANPMSPDCPEAWCYAMGGTLFLMNPLGALVVHTFDVGQGSIGIGSIFRNSSGSVYLAVAVVAAAAAVVAVVVTGLRLRADLERSAVASTQQGFRAWFAKFLGHHSPGADHGPARLAKPVWERPLLWKESRPPRGPWAHALLWLLYVAYAGFMGWLWFYPKIRRNLTEGLDTPFYDVMAVMPLWLFLLAAMKSCGTFLAEERERNALDLLRAAPIAPRDFFIARFLGSGARLLPLAAISAVLAIVGTFMGHNHALGLAAWAVGGCLIVPFFGLVVFRAGMAGSTVRVAQRRAVACLGLFTAGWLVLHWALSLAGHVPESVHEVLLALNPFAAMTGPYNLYAHLTFDFQSNLPLGNQVRFGLAGTAAAFLWGGAAWFLWERLPKDLDRALHGAEEA